LEVENLRHFVLQIRRAISLVKLHAGGPPKRSRPFGVLGDESLQGYADATSQTSTF